MVDYSFSGRDKPFAPRRRARGGEKRAVAARGADISSCLRLVPPCCFVCFFVVASFSRVVPTSISVPSELAAQAIDHDDPAHNVPRGRAGLPNVAAHPPSFSRSYFPFSGDSSFFESQGGALVYARWEHAGAICPTNPLRKNIDPCSRGLSSARFVSLRISNLPTRAVLASRHIVARWHRVAALFPNKTSRT